MSVIDQIRKLDEQKTQLLETAKKEALDKAHEAVAELGELGFHYKLIEEGGEERSAPTPRAPRAAPSGRRAGIREEVLKLVSEKKDGVTRNELLHVMGAKGQKAAEQSISNALAALKKAGTLTLNGGTYKAA